MKEKLAVFNNGSGRPAGPFSTTDIIDSPVDINGDYTIAAGPSLWPSKFILDLQWEW